MNEIFKGGSYRDAFETLMQAIDKNDIAFGNGQYWALWMLGEACRMADASSDVKYGEWISVNNRLPKNSDWVLVYGDGKIYMAFVDQDDQWCVDADGYDGHIENVDWVTHWMPLPEMPGGKR